VAAFAATRSPVEDHSTEPECSFRPSPAIGHPAATSASPTAGRRYTTAVIRPSTLGFSPRRPRPHAQPLGQSSAAHTTPSSTSPPEPPSAPVGIHGQTTVFDGSPAGAGKIRNPSLSARCGPHVKQVGNAWSAANAETSKPAAARPAASNDTSGGGSIDSG